MEDIETIHQQFCEYGQHAKEWLRKCQLLLPLVAKYEIWKKKNFSSIYEYAAKLAGMSRNNVDNCLWVLRKVEDKPALLKVVEDYGIHRVKAVAALATSENEDFWAKKARQMSQHTLETYVRETKQILRAEKNESENIDVSITLKPDLARRVECLKKHGRFQDRFENFIRQFEEELSKEIPEPVKTLSRHVPAHIERHVEERTSGLCAFPKCKKEATSHHHTQRWALEKVHDPTRLHALCTEHERLMHHGLISNEEGPPEGWSIRKEPDRSSPRFWIDQMVSLYR